MRQTPACACWRRMWWGGARVWDGEYRERESGVRGQRWEVSDSGQVDGAVALKDCVRVLNGFGSSLEGMLPKLRDGFIAQDADTARRLASEYPQSFFLSPGGEAFHNATVTGGRVRAQGPLALKRELSEVREKLNATETALAQAETAAAGLEREMQRLTAALEAKTDERRDAERESANSGAALRQMRSEEHTS